MPKQTQASRRGRPKGAKTNPPPKAVAALSRCPTCGSTDREPYFNTTEQAIAGVHDGERYTHVVWRRTRCTACGQVRVDRTYELRQPDRQKPAA